ncbi:MULTISPECIES: hypothetical protein [Mycolicibacterium]|uniref:Uncharacterized protein n=1 Tax=Mycolicibacterium senegalense TaxID=1796 RepID=A0ABR5G1Z6_9MYCO|nr:MULTISPECIES: hypothetical protein [Mycolicibacterium]KLI04079.1 hypothetical protein AA982_32110 [Mycolicibacterium senegalense]KLO54217.1 hypothetical protein ABW05_24890 [Mycolicibacterium senegalense]OBK01892.1 hypothetical protein A5639_25225 [Mycolicibacterium conceptionense]OMB78355.1 hypothetical protein A5741_29085 [Mycolicibacterium conceptionense]OMB85998.1 hypothetical protein A5746_27140 [Mycolicibacterium conceptionense]
MPRIKTKKRRRSAPKAAANKTAGGYLVEKLKERFGWRPSTRPFHTTAKRECGGCRRVLTGDRFDVPVTPGRPDLNKCKECI